MQSFANCLTSAFVIPLAASMRLLTAFFSFCVIMAFFPFRRETFDFSGDFTLGIKYKCLQY